MSHEEQIAVLNRASEAGYFETNVNQQRCSILKLAEFLLGEGLHQSVTWNVGPKPWHPIFLLRTTPPPFPRHAY